MWTLLSFNTALPVGSVFPLPHQQPRNTAKIFKGVKVHTEPDVQLLITCGFGVRVGTAVRLTDDEQSQLWCTISRRMGVLTETVFAAACESEKNCPSTP
jgi:hypothetical protein